MVFYIFVIAVVNVCLGFALATHLARRYRALTEMPALSWPARHECVEDDPPNQAGAASKTAWAGGELEAGAEEIALLIPEAVAPPAPDREKAPGAAAVHDFQDHVRDYEKRLASVDAELRSCVEDPDEVKVKACLDSLREVNQEYVEHRDQAQEALEKLSLDQEMFDSIRDNLKAAIARQSSSIDTAKTAAKEFDYQGDLEEGCKQMAGETNKLLEANDHLRDTLGEARKDAARSERLLDEKETRSRLDPLTHLPDRTALEAELRAWWQRDPHRQRPLCMAMLDVDEFTQVNEEYGRKVGDAILRALVQFFNAEKHDSVLVSRFSGERFVFLFPDSNIRYATNLVERVRQTVEMAHFRYHDTDIQVTVSCSVTEVTKQDQSETVFARAEATLREAKRYGRNRTFQHEGKYPTPVVPPNFTLEEKRLEI